MRVYEPKRNGDLRLVDGEPDFGAIVYRKGRRIAEFDYARDAFAFVQRQHDLGVNHLRIHNPSA